jgi:hypothetical protein
MTALKVNDPPRLLVLGGPDSGKTTYRAQLYQRIEHLPGELRLRSSVDDTTAIEKDVERLVQGLQPLHTNRSTYHSTTFSVEDRAGRPLVLEFADYDGEQVRKMSESNRMPLPWVERARQAQSWMYFLRIDPVRPDKGFMTDPVGSAAHVESSPSTDMGSDQSPEISAIEVLQRLLFSRGASLRHPLSSPRLAVLLSCWDELTDGEGSLPPVAVLEKRAPLLYRFVAANWLPMHRQVWGLSSIEQRLPEKDPNREFARKGPEHFGFIVRDDGQRDRDLTLPLGWLMQPHQ